jgi:hypothetical protein
MNSVVVSFSDKKQKLQKITRQQQGARALLLSGFLFSD